MLVLAFYVAKNEGLSRHNSFSIYLDHCHYRVKDFRDSVLFNLL